MTDDLTPDELEAAILRWIAAHPAESAELDAEVAEYRRTHSRDGYGLGTGNYPDNRVGRRRLARSWKRAAR